jgi:hypothetical protein
LISLFQCRKTLDTRTLPAHNSSNTDAHSFDKAIEELRLPNSRVRSIVFAAAWYVPYAATKWIVHSGSGHVVLSGKNNGGVAANVMCNSANYLEIP